MKLTSAEYTLLTSLLSTYADDAGDVEVVERLEDKLDANVLIED